MKNKTLLIIGKLIRKIRLEQNISQEKLSELSNTDRSYMGRIERGEKNITILKLYDICSALNISVEEFFIQLSN